VQGIPLKAEKVIGCPFFDSFLGTSIEINQLQKKSTHKQDAVHLQKNSLIGLFFTMIQ